MNAICTLNQLPDGSVQIRHSSATLGDVALTAASRDQVLDKMQKELQYRYELCPCSGVSMGTVRLEIREVSRSRRNANASR